MVRTAKRVSAFSIISLIVSIILLFVFLVLAGINKGFAFITLLLFVNIILSMVLFVIAEAAIEDIFPDLSGWLKKQWNLMLGRDECGSHD